MDPRALGHPDLEDLGLRMRHRLDRVLEAEQEAAVVLARRTASLRDRLLEAEDAAALVTVTVVGGTEHRGRVSGVGLDHLELTVGASSVLLPFDVLVAVWLW